MNKIETIASSILSGIVGGVAVSFFDNGGMNLFQIALISISGVMLFFIGKSK